MPTLKRFLVFIFFILPMAKPIEAVAGTNLQIDHLFEDTKLSESFVLSICKDSYGFIWIGTYNGVYRYDGYNYSSPFNRASDSAFLNNKSVHVIYEDKDSNLWFGSETGLFEFKRKEGVLKGFHYSNDGKSLNNEHIRTIVQIDQKYYIGTYGGGLNIYDPITDRFEVFLNQSVDSARSVANRINGIFVDRHKKLWIATEAGIGTFEESTKTFRLIDGKGRWPKGQIINCFFEDQTGLIWIGTWDNGIYSYEPETGLFDDFEPQFEKLQDKYSKNIRSIIQFDNKTLWLASVWEGLFTLDLETNEVNKVKFTTSLPQDNVSLWSMLREKSGVIWLGGFGNGLFQYNPTRNQFKSFPANEKIAVELKKMEISAFCEDRDGNLFIGTLKNGIFELNNTYTQLTQIYNAPGDLQNIVRFLYVDPSNRVWAGCETDLLRIENGHVLIYRYDANRPGSIGKSGIHSITYDKAGNLWVGVWSWGLFCLGKDEIRKANPDEAFFERFQNTIDTSTISDNIVWAIQEDKKGNLYVGTAYSFDYLDRATNRFNHLIKTTPSSIYTDDEGVIWLGTFGKGLLKYTPWDQTVETFDERHGLNSTIINGIVKGNNNDLIVMTNIGISRFSKEYKNFINYNAKSDLGINHLVQHAFVRLRNGALLVGGDNGIVSFNPGMLVENLVAFPIYVTDIKVFNESILPGRNIYDLSNREQITLSHADKMITFEFAALNYSSPEKIKYTYRLEGFDDDWISTSNNGRQATYTNLPSGKYVFHVRSTNLEGLWGENEYSIGIVIKPEFYQTLLFRVTFLIALILLMYLFYNKRIHTIKISFSAREEKLKSKMEMNSLFLENQQLQEELYKKSRELTSNTTQLVAKNQALLNLKNDISNLLKTVSQETKGKLIELHNKLAKNLEDESNWEKYNLNIDIVQDNFISRFSAKHPDITHKDLKICSYMRMNLSNQEIASQLNITNRSLEMARYRIRKKINLHRSINLNDYILKF